MSETIKKMFESLPKIQRDRIKLGLVILALFITFLSFNFGVLSNRISGSHPAVFEGENQQFTIGYVELYGVAVVDRVEDVSTGFLNHIDDGSYIDGKIDTIHLKVVGECENGWEVKFWLEKKPTTTKTLCVEYGDYVIVSPLTNTYWDENQLNGLRDNEDAFQWKSEKTPEPTSTAETVIEENKNK